MNIKRLKKNLNSKLSMLNNMKKQGTKNISWNDIHGQIADIKWAIYCKKRGIK